MDIVNQRLHGTLLVGPPRPNARDVVGALGAVQAQDYDGAKWALGMRSTQNDAAIETSFNTGDILRTHVLRPTWHFIERSDIRWLLALTGPQVKRTMAPYNRHLELDEAAFRRANRILVRALRDGRYLTRAELKRILVRARVGTLSVQRTAHLLMRAELESIICSGPRRGKQFTYALLDERAPATPSRDRDEAIHELALRYFHTRGPATPQDFSWWSGLRMPDVRRALALVRTQLESVTLDGTVYWFGGHRHPRARPSAHLLPNYDEYFIGYRDRSAIGRRLKSLKAVTGGNAVISNVVTLNGQVVGGWRRTAGREAVQLRLTLLDRLTPAERSRVRRQVNRYATFLGTSVEWEGVP